MLGTGFYNVISLHSQRICAASVQLGVRAFHSVAAFRWALLAVVGTLIWQYSQMGRYQYISQGNDWPNIVLDTHSGRSYTIDAEKHVVLNWDPDAAKITSRWLWLDSSKTEHPQSRESDVKSDAIDSIIHRYEPQIVSSDPWTDIIKRHSGLPGVPGTEQTGLPGMPKPPIPHALQTTKRPAPIRN
jgi:hypothetical protein